jgi:hypothetical protein
MRRIVFTNDELRRALDAHLVHRNGASMPTGLVTSVTFDADKSNIVLAIQDRRSDENHTIEVSSAHVAAALLRYCFSTRLPLPKHASKSLVISGDNVALDMKFDAEPASILRIDHHGAKKRA